MIVLSISYFSITNLNDYLVVQSYLLGDLIALKFLYYQCIDISSDVESEFEVYVY